MDWRENAYTNPRFQAIETAIRDAIQSRRCSITINGDSGDALLAVDCVCDTYHYAFRDGRLDVRGMEWELDIRFE